MRVSAQSLFNTSGQQLPLERIYAPIDYAVVGQQKSGTSTLWNLLTWNSAVRWAGFQKEQFYFAAEIPKTVLCDQDIQTYLGMASIQRLRENRTDALIGDWSATYFSCICCAASLRTLNPKMKIIVVLRDPADRTLSRFLEQKRHHRGPFGAVTANHTFASWVAFELAELRGCLERAAVLKAPPGVGTGAGGPEFPGWGAGWSLHQWMEAQCYSRSNIVGWSVYAPFLENWLAQFGPQKVMVVYTAELATDPASVLQRLEAFLEVPPAKYNPDNIKLVFNSRDCYNWRCAKKKGEISSSEAASNGTNAGIDPRAAAFKAAMQALVEFYKPGVQRLVQWADAGKITKVPAEWRSIYGV
ncbi:hypothetical protein HYH03_007643 [Edaphochlamys debaryana]|uniref:Sulfotransferase n=1 Tax=Edaphochlamys debaryana TaxID=47281 RepID=A0A836BZ38_9CHLO|nr:hypothetical protein HYH03_007643 [Edaphochlamys debaryana]|eukprot:KAG2494290.1 hypothetical protein HYH03_007643 [Edaphochlamys debaryana]